MSSVTISNRGAFVCLHSFLSEGGREFRFAFRFMLDRQLILLNILVLHGFGSRCTFLT